MYLRRHLHQAYKMLHLMFIKGQLNCPTFTNVESRFKILWCTIFHMSGEVFYNLSPMLSFL